MIDLPAILMRFSHNANAIRALVADVDSSQARWRPAPDEWSILEVITHLYDEEREDFRTRLDILLHQPDQPWPPIDPAGWVRERKYNDRDLAESLANFLAEREQSLVWLRELTNPAWDNCIEHPNAGQFCARDMLASWLAHDALHIRQLVQIQREYIAMLTDSGRIDYAGEW